MKNEYEIRGDHVAIYIKKKDGRTLETLIDISDLPRVKEMEFTWFETNGYVSGTKHEKHAWYKTPIRVGLHRWIFNDPEDCVIDHLNHDTLDNRKSNLRVVTHSENMQNIKKGHGKSGVLGVHWEKRKNRWKAVVCKDKKQYHFGSFKTIEEARIAAEAGKIKVHHYYREEVYKNV